MSGIVERLLDQEHLIQRDGLAALIATGKEAADTITDLMAALEPFQREWLDMGNMAHLSDNELMLDVDCGGEILTVGHWRRLVSCFAKAKGETT